MDLTAPEFRSPAGLVGAEAAMDINLLAERFLFFYPVDLVNAQSAHIRAAMRHMQTADRHIREAYEARREVARPPGPDDF